MSLRVLRILEDLAGYCFHICFLSVPLLCPSRICSLFFFNLVAGKRGIRIYAPLSTPVLKFIFSSFCVSLCLSSRLGVPPQCTS